MMPGIKRWWHCLYLTFRYLEKQDHRMVDVYNSGGHKRYCTCGRLFT
jgi:hypothetical protein